MNIPSQATMSAGGTLTAAIWNDDVRDAVNFFLGVPHVILTQTVAQAVVTGTFTAITWDVEVRDNDSAHSTVTNTSRVTVPTPGWYEFGGSHGWAGSTAGRRISRWAINGTAINGTEVTATNPPATTVAFLAKTDSAFLNTNDYLELFGFQDTGGSLNTGVSGAAISRMWAKWIGS